MKKIILISVLAMFSITSFSHVLWNVKAGMNISNWSEDDSDYKIGYKLGAGMEYMFSDIWSIQPSLLLSGKGAKGVIEGFKMTVNQMYLELSIMAAARIKIADNTNFQQGHTQPMEQQGSVKFHLAAVDVKWNTFGNGKVAIGGEEIETEGFDRFDAGLGAGVGVEFGKIIIGLESQFGLIKLNDVDDAPKNTNFSISLGYKF